MVLTKKTLRSRIPYLQTEGILKQLMLALKFLRREVPSLIVLV